MENKKHDEKTIYKKDTNRKKNHKVLALVMVLVVTTTNISSILHS